MLKDVLGSLQKVDHFINNNIYPISIKRALICVVTGKFVCDYDIGLIFDSTYRYPGEGLVSNWSSKHSNLPMTV